MGDYRYIVLAIFIVVIGVSGCLLVTPVNSAEKECYPIATLKISFQVVFPNAEQVTIEGDAAKAYLTEYNSFGRPTSFVGETIFLNISL